MSYKNTYPQRKQAGESLIVIMIGLVFGLFISGAAILMFISDKATYPLDSALSRMQDAGRSVVDSMALDIRMTGYMGCASRSDVVIDDVGNPDVGFSNASGIQGFNNGASWTNPTSYPRVDGSDVITVSRASENTRQLNTAMATKNADLVVNSLSVSIGAALLITDCTKADAFRVSSLTIGSTTTTIAHGNNKNDSASLSTKYPATSQVSTLHSATYFIGMNTAGTPALFRITNAVTNTTDELLDGVEDMQILYGEDTNGDYSANDYFDASGVTNWEDVTSVRISLLLRSADNITPSPSSITFNGATVNSGSSADRRLRTIYNSTVTLRNRLP